MTADCNPMTTPDTQTLKEAAEKATPGPWSVDDTHNEGEYGGGEDSYSGFKSYVVGCGPESEQKHNLPALIHTLYTVNHTYFGSSKIMLANRQSSCIVVIVTNQPPRVGTKG